MNSTYTEEKYSIHLAKDLEEKGYSVTHLPSPEHIPFSLEGYVPDLIAEKEGDHLIVEVKPKGDSGLSRRLVRVAEIVERHPGWRLLVKNIPDSGFAPASESLRLNSLQEIGEHLQKAGKVMEAGLPELSIPYLWNAVVSLLRIQANREQLSWVGLSDASIINQHYTMGLISIEEYQKLKRWRTLRNDAVHSVSFQTNQEEIVELKNFAEKLVRKLRNQASSQVE